MTQDPQLFSGTIRENLLFVKPDATDEEMHDALRRASATQLMDRSGKGLDTRLGESGLRVSGGERQRLSIARALLRHPRLFIFDEATSALDSITEQEITTAVRRVSGSKEHMVILIAHRLSTILHADTIYVLEKGRITESGTHDSLLEKKGLYYAMWRQQIGERDSRHFRSADESLLGEPEAEPSVVRNLGNHADGLLGSSRRGLLLRPSGLGGERAPSQQRQCDQNSAHVVPLRASAVNPHFPAADVSRNPPGRK